MHSNLIQNNFQDENFQKMDCENIKNEMELPSLFNDKRINPVIRFGVPVFIFINVSTFLLAQTDIGASVKFNGTIM